MRGMGKYLVVLFFALTALYYFFWGLTVTVVFWIGTFVLVGIGGGLTLLAYLAARASRPRPAASYLPKEKK